MAAIEAALVASRAGDCQPQDVAVTAYIMSAIDRRTGACARHYETIAEGCGMSRSAVGRSIKRLVDAGVIERTARFARNRAQIATAFTIAEGVIEAIARRNPGHADRGFAGSSRPTSGTPPSRRRDTKLVSHGSLHPVGGAAKKGDKLSPIFGQGPSKDARQEEAGADWGDHADWLAEAGQYDTLWGYGAGAGAGDDLSQWRREKGDRAMLRAIERAKSLGLHGARLWDYLDKTWPIGGTYDRDETAKPDRSATAPPGSGAAEDGGRTGSHRRRAGGQG